MKYKINAEKKKLFKEIENSNDHFFVTGKAGTGKSTLLNYLTEYSDKETVVVAPTGMAAVNVGGQTIHSIFRIPPYLYTGEEELEKLDYKAKKLLQNVEMIVLDEVSMVRADLMDAIDKRLREANESNIPFGGKQMIFFGDPYQLPPVVADYNTREFLYSKYEGVFFFNANCINDIHLEVRELEKVFRQKDQDFLDVLNKIRIGEVDSDLFEILNARKKDTIPNDKGMIVLSTHNASVDRINTSSLSNNKNDLIELAGKVDGQFAENRMPTALKLKLKKGAQVVILKNDKDMAYVNGSIGKVIDFDKGSKELIIEIEGVEHRLDKHTWEDRRYYYDNSDKKVDYEVISSFSQYPVKLAFALSIHKSQGQTYTKPVLVDLSNGVFEAGQAYVALSRINKLDNLYLRTEIEAKDIIVNEEVKRFMNR